MDAVARYVAQQQDAFRQVVIDRLDPSKWPDDDGEYYITEAQNTTDRYFVEDLERGSGILAGNILKLDGAFEYLVSRNLLNATNASTKEQLVMARQLSIQADQNVYLMKSANDGKDWVVKWPKGREELNYLEIQKRGGKTPIIKTGFTLGGIPLLVIEHLAGLDVQDDPVELVQQLLRTQLKYIHQFATHQDLKPDNIRKRINPDGTIEYFIIDMDLITTTMSRPISYLGKYESTPPRVFHRGIATPFYSSTPLALVPFFTYKEDIKELMLVYNEMLLQKAYQYKMGYFDVTKYDAEWNNPVFALWMNTNPPPEYRNIESFATHAANVERMRTSPLLKERWFWEFVSSILFIFNIDESLFGGQYAAFYLQMHRLLFDAPPVSDNETHDMLAREFTNNPTNKDALKRYHQWQEQLRALSVDGGLTCHICGSIATHKCIGFWKPQFLCSSTACSQEHVCL